MKELDYGFKPKLNKSTIENAIRYRNKVLTNPDFNVISLTNAKTEESNSLIQNDRNKKTVNLQEIYNNLKIKKER